MNNHDWNNNYREGKGSKAAESRKERTKSEVVYLATAYYNCAQFVVNSGYNSDKIINQQFENMLSNFINDGKIKRESYNKFCELRELVDVKTYGSPESYASAIARLYLDSINTDLSKLRADQIYENFKKMLADSGIALGKVEEQIIYSQFLRNIADATGSYILNGLYEKTIASYGLRALNFNGPTVMTSEGDGCSHGITYGSALKNMDKVRKYGSL